MRNAFKFLVASALIAGSVTAQEKSESVDGILKELNARKGGTTAPATPSTTVESVAPAAAEEAVEVAVEVAAPAETVEVAAPAETVEVAAAEPNSELDPEATEALDVPATLDASRELYVGGEFEQAQKGFEAVIKKDPENLIARSYLRKILERDPRTAEVQGIKNVKKAWKTGIVLRSYEVSAEAVEKMGLQDVKDSMDVTMKFPEVKFPKGASAVYQPKTGKLFVRNTTENLTVIEEIFAAMDISNAAEEVDQVEIESKFVEVAEGTLEQLGFEWQSIAGENYKVLNNGNITGF
ncbi:MAG: hypothetical protein FJ220_04525, partial [Kiritimatiellaceae bacterium]|nr:hypothetical protein [Kiritimatiellaceae bacterium]